MLPDGGSGNPMAVAHSGSYWDNVNLGKPHTVTPRLMVTSGEEGRGKEGGGVERGEKGDGGRRGEQGGEGKEGRDGKGREKRVKCVISRFHIISMDQKMYIACRHS